MKFVCERRPDRIYMAAGLLAAFNKGGHDFIVWNPVEKSAFDVFDEVEPEVFIAGATTMANRAVAKCIEERRPRGKLKTVDMDTIAPAGDTSLFHRVEKRRDLSCDVAHVGPFNSLLLPLCDQSSPFRVKICGPSPWPIPQYVGPINDKTLPYLYASAMTSVSFGDLETVYQILLSGGLPIVQYFPGSPFNVENVLMFRDSLELQDLVSRYTRKSRLKERESVINTGLRVIRQGNTYCHRAAAILESVGRTTEANKMLGIYEATRTI